MKVAGTLKCEIIRPEGETWDEVGGRMRALRDTLAPALNETMRALYPAAMSWIAAMRDGNKEETKLRGKWQNMAKKELLSRWKKEMARRLEYEQARNPDTDERRYAPPFDCLSDRELVLARFKGQPLKDLLASRVSIPSWRNGAAFYSEGRKCEVAGTADKAKLTYPLWGTGSRSTVLAIAPCGKNYRALWRRLVAGEAKLGRVGIKYDQRKRKWYALISWTEERRIEKAEGQRAACNFGVNVFLQAVAEDGAAFRVEGTDILVTRKRYAHRRHSIQKSLDTMGKGCRGHGKKRRLAPLTKLMDAESRWSSTKCRMVAAELVAWCIRHNVAHLILEDLSGVRDSRDMHENINRLIHQWPFYELRQAVERRALEAGVTVEVKPPSYNSQRCPKCAHTSEENVRQVAGREEVMIARGGKAWTRREKRSVFECISCGTKADGDVVAATNLLAGDTCSVIDITKSKGKKAARKKAGRALAAEG